MSAMSDYLRSAFLDHVLLNKPYTAADVLYLALFNETNELNTRLGYVRQSVAFQKVSDNKASTAGETVFGPAINDDWGTVTHVACMDAPDGGNILFSSRFEKPQILTVGASLRIPIGDVTVCFG